MAWSDAKAAIKALLEAVSITSPSSISMKNVFDDPPPRLGPADTPACILFPPGVDVERQPGGWRRKQYNYRVRLYVHDADYDRASAITENFVEKVIDKFDDTSSVRKRPKLRRARSDGVCRGDVHRGRLHFRCSDGRSKDVWVRGENMAHRMKYIGENPATDWLPLVPASDHEVETKKLADELVASGLYEIDRRRGSQAAAANKSDSESDSEDAGA